MNFFQVEEILIKSNRSPDPVVRFWFESKKKLFCSKDPFKLGKVLKFFTELSLQLNMIRTLLKSYCY